MINRPERETAVATLLRHFGEGPIKRGRLSFKYDDREYPISNLDKEKMTYGDKSWTLPISDARFFITDAWTKRSLCGVSCVVCIGYMLI